MKSLLIAFLLVLAVMVCVPQTTEAAIFGNRSRQVVVQRNRQQVVRQQVVRQRVVQQRVVQQVVVPHVQQVRVQQLNNGCHNDAGVLQFNSNGCAALYGR